MTLVTDVFVDEAPWLFWMVPMLLLIGSILFVIALKNTPDKYYVTWEHWSGKMILWGFAVVFSSIPVMIVSSLFGTVDRGVLEEDLRGVGFSGVKVDREDYMKFLGVIDGDLQQCALFETNDVTRYTISCGNALGELGMEGG